MSDLNALVSAIADSGSAAPVKFRQGAIVTVNTDSTANVTIAGSTTTITNVKVASHVCPIPGATCWLATDGRDWFVFATLGPTGPAFGTMRKSTAQNITSAAFTELAWGSRTDTTANGMALGSTGITVVVPGIYSVSANIDLDASSTAGSRYGVLYLNGAIVAQGNGGSAPSSATFNSRMGATAILKLVPGDIVNAGMYQNGGATYPTAVGAGYNVLSAVWIGPSA